MTLAVLTFVKKENLEQIKQEGFKPSQSRRTFDRTKKEQLMNESVSLDKETPMIYGIVVDEDLIEDVARTARLHGEVAILWSFHENTSFCVGDSLVGKGYENVVPFSKKNFLEKKEEMLKSREKYGLNHGNYYLEAQIRDFDILQMQDIIHSEEELKEHL